jgi:hypothetical protein
VEPLGRYLPRAALWLVVLLLLAGALFTTAGAQGASSPNYTLIGYATQPGTLGPVPSGVQVDLESRATGAIYTTTVYGNGGQFNFTVSTTGGTLAPGYWGVWIPAQGNLTTGARCNPCAILPTEQNPSYAFFNTSALTSVLYPAQIAGVQVVALNGTLKGTVTDKSSGVVESGAIVQLLDPQYDDYVLSNTTTFANGTYVLKVPIGTWVLKTTVPGPTTYFNYTKVTIPNRSPVTANVAVTNYLISGFMDLPSGAPIPTGGNVTVWDPTSGYIYSNPTPGGGFYSFGSYPGNFTGGPNSYDVILSAVGYQTVWYPVTISGAPYVRNVVLPPLVTGQRGTYATTVNLTGIDVYSGTGSVAVNTSALLGNDTVIDTLPNESVGQLWGQLGLDFAHSPSFPSADLSDLYAFENQSGPFYPAAQAGLAINGTSFFGPSAPQKLSSFSSSCTATTCGLSSSATIRLGWNESYTLNGTLALNSSTYSISFGFAHPTSSDAYNYTFVLPAGYVLSAGTAPPSNTRLAPAGPGGTWTSFTLVSLPSPSTAGGTASFTIQRYSNLTANVNISTSYFAFSSKNVLNETHGNYTVVVGVGQNVTFSALNSSYPAGTNGTRFVWDFGDLSSKTTGQPTTNHTYSTASGQYPYNGTLTVTSSGGLVNSTEFYVWVGEGPVTAVLSTNATAGSNRTAGTTTYVYVNWGTVLSLNATFSTANISSSAPIKGVVSVAYFTIQAKGYKVTQNYSLSQNSEIYNNWSYQFLGAGVYYKNHTTIGGTPVYFKGWQYNVTLTVWDGMGQSATTNLVIVVNDVQKPVASFQVLNYAGAVVSGSGVVAGSNLTAKIQLDGANATDPNNGSLTKYYWLVTNSGNSTVHSGFNVTSVKPYPALWLAPQAKAYTINLTVTDLNGNKGWTTQSLSVSRNATLSPIMAANNLTAPTKMTAGTTYTIWVNITESGGTQSTGQNVSVSFYTTPPGGTARSPVGGGSYAVKFYNYTDPGVVNTVPFATGKIASMPYNATYRAVITWYPTRTGNFYLYANVTATNEYIGDIEGGTGVVSLSITVNPNPTTQLYEYLAIAAAVIVVIFLIVVFYRRRTHRGQTPRSSGRSGLERGRSKDDDEDDET